MSTLVQIPDVVQELVRNHFEDVNKGLDRLSVKLSSEKEKLVCMSAAKVIVQNIDSLPLGGAEKEAALGVFGDVDAEYNEQVDLIGRFTKVLDKIKRDQMDMANFIKEYMTLPVVPDPVGPVEETPEFPTIRGAFIEGEGEG